ncbi:MAG: ATP-binding protein, partial [Candidatus Omnitrophica bacterium]|nr:ATP-binding protein [Candidatus Omnitrophota bacterium]
VLHAPRQTGKTTCLLALMEHLNAAGQYKCLYINVEPAQSAREDVDKAIRAILSGLSRRASRLLNDDFLKTRWLQVLEESGGHAALGEALSLWAQNSSQPLILLIDEIDALIGDTLISVLRQLREGYTDRPGQFPQSIMLCGVRDVRDYRIHSSKDKAIITGGSAFNIKAKSLRLGDFSQEEIKVLYNQHTEETGQVFEDEVLTLAWNLTRGQPWLTNALAYEACFEMEASKDRTQPITAQIFDEARERLILRGDTHLDQLTDKLQEDRVRRVIGPILAGETGAQEFKPDDVQYLLDLGLIRREAGMLAVANALYKEVIPRELTWTSQLSIPYEQAWYVNPEGRLEMAKLLSAFQDFFRQHSEHWRQLEAYQEAGPQLLLQAFLQRVVNAGGRIEREYGLGRGRTDLLVTWTRAGQRFVIEMKIQRGSLENILPEALEQTIGYADTCGADEAHLIVFDRRGDRTWEEKIYCREESCRDRSITVWGM